MKAAVNKTGPPKSQPLLCLYTSVWGWVGDNKYANEPIYVEFQVVISATEKNEAEKGPRGVRQEAMGLQF